ncbi:MAG: O-antigen ligase family protein [Solirubrobacteraceae bacterium]|nr:O-antigen ligase family protein [Solirubrobacteraceae bacterium]
MTTSPILQERAPSAWQPSRMSRLAAVMLGGIALFVATATVKVLDYIAPSLPLAIAGGMGLLFLVALSVARYETAVFLGFLLSGVVKIEPAPPDGVFAIVMAIAIVTGRFRVDRVPAPVAFALTGLVILNVLSFAAAYSIGVGFLFASITFYVVIFAVWLAGYADRDKRGRQIVIAWLWIAIFSALLGTLALELPSFPFRDEFIGDGASRASALFKDPNVYGPFLVPVAVIVLEEIINPHILRMRAVTGLLIVGVLVVGLIFSFSRASWANMLLSTAVMLFVLLLRRRNTGRLFAVVGGLGVVGMIIMAVVVFSGNADFIGQRAQLQGYDTERFGAQRAGLEIAEQYPLGVGPGQFQFHHPIETHSTYVRTLAEQGPLGLVFWLAICLTTLFFAVGNALAGRRSGGIGSAALLGAWCGLLFNSAVVDTLHWRHLWVVAGLIWAGTLTGRRDERAARGG